MSGLDRISFGTDGWRDHRDAFTEERVEAIGDAFLEYLIDAGHDDAPIAIGFDARPEADTIAGWLADRAVAAGFDVWMAPRDCPTPALAVAINDFDLAGGFMVSASHNPPTYHGIKLIPYGGAPAMPSVTDAVEASLGTATPATGRGVGEIESFDFIEYHIETVLDRVDPDLRGLTIAYDAMHGSGRGVTDTVLEAAGADVIRLRCDPDPMFGGTPPEPDAENLETLVDTVAEGDADFGIANDGDADRVAIVTDRGYVDPNMLYAVLYEHLLETDSGPAVRTVSTTYLIDRIADAHGESVVETPVGFKWVADAMASHDALIGGEDSNGLSIRGHVREKDGVFVGALAAHIHARRSFDDRIAELFERYGRIVHVTANVDCPNERKTNVLDTVAAAPPESFDGVEVESIADVDGLKFQLTDGSWVLVRPSGTEAKLRVYSESTDDNRASKIAEEAASLLESIVDI